MAKLTIDFEKNVNGFYEIDMNNPPFDYDSLTEEEQKEIDVYNNQFIEGELTNRLLALCAPCPCRVQEVMMKHQNRARLVGQDKYVPTLDQDDVDAYTWAVVISSKDGKYTSVDMIVKECKNCHEIHTYGDSSVYGRLLAESFTHYADSKTEEADEVQDVEITDEELKDMTGDYELHTENVDNVVNLFGDDQNT